MPNPLSFPCDYRKRCDGVDLPIGNFSSEDRETGPPFWSVVYPRGTGVGGIGGGIDSDCIVPCIVTPPPPPPTDSCPENHFCAQGCKTVCVSEISQEVADQCAADQAQYCEPPPDLAWYANGCKGVCVSYVSQDDADLCAMRQAVECVVETPFYNSEQICFNTDDDGTTYYYIVAAGLFAAPTQAEADMLAYAFACANAKGADIPGGGGGGTTGRRRRRVKIGNLPSSVICIDVSATMSVSLTSGTEVGTFSISDGELPPGLSLTYEVSDHATITGIPTTAGLYAFRLRFTTEQGHYAEKDYTLRVIGIPSSLIADGTVGVLYSDTFVGDGGSGNYTFSVASGSLPPGLNLSTAGTISGTPTTAGTYAFDITMLDTTLSASCQKSFGITVAAASGVTLLSYWKCDDAAPVTKIVNSVPGMYDLDIWSFSGGSVAGKIGTAVDTYHRTFDTDSHAEYDIGLLSSFTLRGWWNLALDTGGLEDAIFDCYPCTLFIRNDGAGNSWYEFEVALQGGGTQQVISPYITTGVYHRVVCWFEQGVGIGIKIDNDAAVLTNFVTPLASSMTGLVNLEVHRLDVTDLYMDELAMWSGKLSDAQLLNDWDGGAGKTYPDVP